MCLDPGWIKQKKTKCRQHLSLSFLAADVVRSAASWSCNYALPLSLWWTIFLQTLSKTDHSSWKPLSLVFVILSQQWEKKKKKTTAKFYSMVWFSNVINKLRLPTYENSISKVKGRKYSLVVECVAHMRPWILFPALRRKKKKKRR